jgi:hypothetical protein
MGLYTSVFFFRTAGATGRLFCSKSPLNDLRQKWTMSLDNRVITGQ